MGDRVRVIFAGDCYPCPDCAEPVCPVCNEHYSDCACPGPHSEEDGWTFVEENGALWAYRNE